MEKTILNITLDENDMITVNIPKQDLAIMAITDVLWDKLTNGQEDALTTLFAITVHLLSRDTTGNLQKQYIKNLESVIPQYRDAFKKSLEEAKSKMS